MRGKRWDKTNASFGNEPVVRKVRMAVACATVAVTGLFLVGSGGVPAPPASAQTASRGAPTTALPAFDPKAMQLLQAMADAYTHLPALDQKTEFFSALIPLTPPPGPASASSPMPDGAHPGPSMPPEASWTPAPPRSAPAEGTRVENQRLPRTLHLAFARPNRLLLETEETLKPGVSPVVNRWISDGKIFWTYTGEKNWYTKEKAPGRIRDFARLAHLNSGSLELLMLMGVNPFAKIRAQVDTVQYAGQETVHDVVTDVVVFTLADSTQKVEMRLYLGKDDSLLRRVFLETTPILKANGPLKVGDRLDALADDPPPTSGDGADGSNPGQSIPLIARIVYENTLDLSPRFLAQTFLYVPPKDAFYYTPPGTVQKTIPLKKQFAEMMKNLKRGKTAQQALEPPN
jgi:hypothetical protein